MAGLALGLIETRGLVAALEASDAAAKASDVVVKEIEIPTAGVCTVKIVGEVADVTSAVDAAVDAAGRVGEVLAHHVIPRPDPELEAFLYEKKIVYSDSSGAVNAFIRASAEEDDKADKKKAAKK